MKKKWEYPQISELQVSNTEHYNNSSGYDWYGAGHAQAASLLSLGSSKTNKTTILIVKS